MGNKVVKFEAGPKALYQFKVPETCQKQLRKSKKSKRHHTNVKENKIK